MPKSATPDPLDDDRISATLTYGLGQCVGFTESKMAKEREKVARYLQGERPHPAHPGDSTFRSLDVWDSVETMKAQLLETFAGNGRPVHFKPMPGEDDDDANIRTEAVTDTLFRQNHGYKLISTVLQDGLIGRNGVVKYWWETRQKTEEYDLSDAGAQEVSAFLMKNPGAEVSHIELDEGSDMGDGMPAKFKRVRVQVMKDRSQVRIRPLPGEEFLISPMAESIEEAELVVHRQWRTMSELRKDGYDPDILDTLQDNDRIWLQMEPEQLVRFEQTDDIIGIKGSESGQFARRTCIVYECYTELDMEDSGESRLWKITMVGNVLLDKEPVDHKPFIDFAPLPRAHAFWGTNYAEQQIPTQIARTYLQRSIINHALTTNNPRLQVVRGAVLNPKELMENRMGGLVNVTRPDGIAPIPQAPLNPYVFQTDQMLKASTEERTGITALSQGLNKDAISKQNSQGMVNDQITLSQTRSKIVARNFAENFLAPLYTAIYRLLVENESRQRLIRVSGSWKAIDISQWPEETDLECSFTLGYGEDDKEVAKWTNFHKAMVADPIFSKMYGPTQAWAVYRKAAAAMGIKDPQNYLMSPQQVPPQKPTPMEIADLQVKQADAKVKQANAQAAVMKLHLDQQVAQAEATDRMAKTQLETRKVTTQLQLEQDKLAHKVAVDAAEIALEQQAQANDKLSAMAEPTRQ